MSRIDQRGGGNKNGGRPSIEDYEGGDRQSRLRRHQERAPQGQSRLLLSEDNLGFEVPKAKAAQEALPFNPLDLGMYEDIFATGTDSELLHRNIGLFGGLPEEVQVPQLYKWVQQLAIENKVQARRTSQFREKVIERLDAIEAKQAKDAGRRRRKWYRRSAYLMTGVGAITGQIAAGNESLNKDTRIVGQMFDHHDEALTFRLLFPHIPEENAFLEDGAADVIDSLVESGDKGLENLRDRDVVGTLVDLGNEGLDKIHDADFRDEAEDIATGFALKETDKAFKDIQKSIKSGSTEFQENGRIKVDAVRARFDQGAQNAADSFQAWVKEKTGLEIPDEAVAGVLARLTDLSAGIADRMSGAVEAGTVAVATQLQAKVDDARVWFKDQIEEAIGRGVDAIDDWVKDFIPEEVPQWAEDWLNDLADGLIPEEVPGGIL